MVYMIADELGWKPFMLSWLNRWVKKMIQIDEDDEFWDIDMRTYLNQLFDKSIDQMHKFISKKTQ